MLKIGGILIMRKNIKRVWNVRGQSHLGLFHRCRQGIIHKMDHSASRKGPDGVRVWQQLSCLVHKDGYQELQETLGIVVSTVICIEISGI